MTMGEQSGPPESLRLLDAAFDAGVNFFDSAEMCASFFYHPTRLPETPQPLK
jgi:aryl-alcohol dehydrogenase-like predicted oxidoreductase